MFTKYCFAFVLILSLNSKWNSFCMCDSQRLRSLERCTNFPYAREKKNPRASSFTAGEYGLNMCAQLGLFSDKYVSGSMLCVDVNMSTNINVLLS